MYQSGRAIIWCAVGGAGVIFLVGLITGAALGPEVAGRQITVGQVMAGQVQATPAQPTDNRPLLRTGHPAQVLRVLDGDTFEARVHVWPGIDITTKVRLRGIDAPEMKARCPDERLKAEAARDALAAMLNDRAVVIVRVGLDKYGGRVLADAATDAVSDIGAAMLANGLARPYDGGKRQSWC